MLAVEYMLLIFEGLKSYFLSLPNCPTVILACFENCLSEAWMYFVQCQASHFNKSIVKIQYQMNTAMEVHSEVANLKASSQAQKDEGFVGIETKLKVTKLEKGAVTKGQVENFVSKAVLFYDTCIQYTDRWDHSDDVNTLSFVLLSKTPTWAEVEASNEMICNNTGQNSSSDDNRLFDQTNCVATYVTSQVIEQWKQSATETAQRWLKVFEHFRRN